jgi:hypothetical protein
MFWVFEWDSQRQLLDRIRCRRYVSEKDRLTLSERRADLDFEEQLREFHLSCV